MLKVLPELFRKSTRVKVIRNKGIECASVALPTFEEIYSDGGEKKDMQMTCSISATAAARNELAGRRVQTPFLPARRNYFGILEARISISTNQPSTTRSAISTTERTGFMGFASVPKNC
jgi:hypothetical protein